MFEPRSACVSVEKTRESAAADIPRKSTYLVALIMVAAFGWLLVPHHHWVRLVQEWLSELGPWAPLIFVAIHVIAIVALIPGAVFSVAAGVLYGPWGFALAVLGATIGASAAFLIARYFARRRVGELIAARPRLDAVRAAVNDEGWRIVFLFYVSPFAPFSVQNYLFGISDIRFTHFFSAMLFGIVPGTLLDVYLGIVGSAATGGHVSVLKWASYAVGIIASVLAAWLVARKARATLRTRKVATPTEHET
jgi:uncharacterized membrane protein YdjX (TVP38/TMEM64 family)